MTGLDSSPSLGTSSNYLREDWNWLPVPAVDVGYAYPDVDELDAEELDPEPALHVEDFEVLDLFAEPPLWHQSKLPVMISG